MVDESQNSETTDNLDGQDNINDSVTKPTRRKMLMMGAVATSAVVSVRPALAQSVASVTQCTLRLRGPHTHNKRVLFDGTLVPHTNPDAFILPHTTFTADEVFKASHGQDFPGHTYGESRAFTNYISRLQNGQGGFTCFVSLHQAGRFKT